MHNTLEGILEIPKKIETRKPALLIPVQQFKEQLRGMLAEFYLSYIQDLLRCLFKGPAGERRKPKKALINEAAEALCFPDAERFNSWFYSFPPQTQGILWYTTFEGYVPARHIETRYNVSLVHQNTDQPWRPTWHFNEKADLDFLLIQQRHGHTHTQRNPLICVQVTYLYYISSIKLVHLQGKTINLSSKMRRS